jgi:nitroreductase
MSVATDTLRPLITTRQIREFTDEPVSGDELGALVEVARWSGSSSNSQPWRFVAVRDRDLIAQLAQAAMPQTRALTTATAALAISLPADSGHPSSNAYDEGRVAERVLIAAHMLGLGAGIIWIRDEFRPQIQGLLGVGADRMVRTIMAIGQPTDTARAYRQEPGKARLPLDELVSWR